MKPSEAVNFIGKSKVNFSSFTVDSELLTAQMYSVI